VPTGGTARWRAYVKHGRGAKGAAGCSRASSGEGVRPVGRFPGEGGKADASPTRCGGFPSRFWKHKGDWLNCVNKISSLRVAVPSNRASPPVGSTAPWNAAGISALIQHDLTSWRGGVGLSSRSVRIAS